MNGTRALAAALCTSLACAAGAAGAAPLKLAIVPLRDSNPGLVEAGPVEQALIEAVRETAWLHLANLSGGGKILAGPRTMSAEARIDPHAVARAQALGRESGAERVVVVEIARLGEGRIAFLQAIDPASGKPVGSTTVSLPGAAQPSAAERALLRAGLVKVIDPARYVGRVQVRVDVAGAELQLDGRRAQTGVSELAVGTHALRVTHPAYRDFLRFVEVEFDRTVALDVGLAAYPLAEGEMTERQRKLAHKRAAPLPWYRSWWALTIAGVVVAGTTAGIIYGTRPSVSPDRTVTFRPSPGP